MLSHATVSVSSWDISGVKKHSLNNLQTHGHSGTKSVAFPSHEPKWQTGGQSVMETVKEPWICCYILLLSVGKLHKRHMTSFRLHIFWLSLSTWLLHNIALGTPCSCWNTSDMLSLTLNLHLLLLLYLLTLTLFSPFYLLFDSLIHSADTSPYAVSVSVFLALIVTYGIMSPFSHTVWVKFGFSSVESVRCRA